MRRKPIRWRVDWHGQGTAPEVGDVVRYVTPGGRISYNRVTGVRVIRNRTPLPPGAVCRYTVTVQRLATPCEARWECNAYTRKPRPTHGTP